MPEKKCLDAVEITFNQNIAIPPGLDGGKYGQDNPGVGDIDFDASRLPPPEFYVISMTEKDIGSGYKAVDVLLEVVTVDGATDYEFTVTEA